MLGFPGRSCGSPQSSLQATVLVFLGGGLLGRHGDPHSPPRLGTYLHPLLLVDAFNLFLIHIIHPSENLEYLVK